MARMCGVVTFLEGSADFHGRIFTQRKGGFGATRRKYHDNFEGLL